MFTKVKTLKLGGLLIFFMVVVLSAPVLAGEFTTMQGRLIDEDCLKAKLTPCPLEKFTGEGLVLVTLDDKVYKIVGDGVPDWKLQKAYTQLVGMRGMKEGNTIMPTDMVQITGDKPLTKACK